MQVTLEIKLTKDNTLPDLTLKLIQMMLPIKIINIFGKNLFCGVIIVGVFAKCKCKKNSHDINVTINTMNVLEYIIVHKLVMALFSQRRATRSMFMSMIT